MRGRACSACTCARAAASWRSSASTPMLSMTRANTPGTAGRTSGCSLASGHNAWEFLARALHRAGSNAAAPAVLGLLVRVMTRTQLVGKSHRAARGNNVVVGGRVCVNFIRTRRIDTRSAQRQRTTCIVSIHATYVPYAGCPPPQRVSGSVLIKLEACRHVPQGLEHAGCDAAPTDPDVRRRAAQGSICDASAHGPHHGHQL